MKKKRYKLEILWDNGVLIETSITETEKELIEQYGRLFIVAKYELEGVRNARPVSFQVWNQHDKPLFPIEPEKVPA